LQKRLLVTGIVFLLPATAFVLVFLIVPILQSFYYSLTDWRGIGEYRFIGMQNYADILGDKLFTESLKRTLGIGISAALLSNVIGLGFAIMLDQKLKTQKWLRALFYIPNVIPIVVAAFVWRYILDANTGLLNKFLSDLSGAQVKVPWIDSPDYVVFAIIMITVWQMMGPIIIVYLAALQGVPHDLIEAAKIDGAKRVQNFFHITLPMIAPGITVNLLLGLANGLKLFDLPYALTGGGPANSSETLSIKIYRYAFNSGQISYGMAASFTLTLVILVITLFFVGFSSKYERGTR